MDSYGFFPDCSSDKLDVILEAVGRQVEKYNKLNPGYEIRFTSGKAVSSADSIFEIRDLLRVAIRRMQTEKTPTGSGAVSSENTLDSKPHAGELS